MQKGLAVAVAGVEGHAFFQLESKGGDVSGSYQTDHGHVVVIELLFVTGDDGSAYPLLIGGEKGAEVVDGATSHGCCCVIDAHA